MKTSPHFYNTQHSPIGAFASFTLGAKGAKGGLAIELGKPADQNVFIGLEDNQGSTFSCLPFFDSITDERNRFEINSGSAPRETILRPFADDQIVRGLTPGTDQWQAGDLKFSIFTPVCPAPDPKRSPAYQQKMAYVPALVVEIVIDNRKGSKPRKFFFGYQGNDPYSSMRTIRLRGAQSGAAIANGGRTAIATKSPGMYASMAFTPEEASTEQDSFNHDWGIGNVGLLIGTAPKGKKTTARFAVCFYHGGIVTTGLEACYYYTRYFKDIEAVAGWTLDNFDLIKSRGADFEKTFTRSSLTPSRRFMLSQAIHSYYGSTELLLCGNRPMWIVNEGEYRMMNTFDLTADQVFFELRLNPWTVENELDWFVKRFAYRDQVAFPGKKQGYRGGISFAHDMGVANHFAPAGRSVYEKSGLHGCFSHMTHEELVNWLMCALFYENKTRSAEWLKAAKKTFRACLQSLLNRDHPDARQRNGIMSLDSSRCSGGSEITTYDSLDASLGQARHNLYLACKTWGVYVGLAALFHRTGEARLARVCKDQAERSSRAIIRSADHEGLLPAVLLEGVSSRIIPAIEGLIIPHFLGLSDALSEDGPYGEFIRVLKIHTKKSLAPGLCLFPDGGWKLSSTSDNSWLSKIYLCQYIAERILRVDTDYARADDTHEKWLVDARNSYWAWSDQMVSGEAMASKYYPRGVTSILWLDL